MSRLAFHLFGRPHLERDGVPLSFDTRKIIALVAYLAVTGQSHTREALITLLWPELEPGRARAVLRRNLSLLRKALDGQWLVVDGETIGLDPDADCWVDVDQFRQRLAACQTHDHPPTEACPDCMPLLEEAAALYRDHFLAGFTLRDSAAFDDWLFFQTEGLKDELARLLVRLATYQTSQGDFESAIRHARRWLALDPLHEPAHRHLMMLYAQAGQRAAALRQYEICRQLLADELGVEPAERTRETYERLLRGELPIGPSAVDAILERELRTVGECPYRGLLAFREADAPFFFGRKAFTDRLAQAVHTRPLVAVIVGSSGSGKSSAVFAGLLPRLREEGDWLIAAFRPGGQPLHALAAALQPILEPELRETERLVEIRRLGQALHHGDIPLDDVVERALEKSARASRLLLLIDQFEELYTLCPEPEVRRDFVDTLLVAVGAVEKRRDLPFVLLLAMRADFMGQALAHRPFADALQESSMMLGPMTREELRAAIEKPAEKQGAALEAGLVERLLDDVGQEPGNLPLLEFALTLLWERLDYGWMTHTAYEEIGRVEGALARYAQEVYDDLAEEERERARRIFVQLVQPGEGTEDTRRVATQEELGEGNWPLVQHLADKRLVVTGQDLTTGSEMVEVVHEALIQRWGQLRAWMAEDRTFRTWQERLRVALSQWEATGQDEGVLLRGMLLVEAEGWLAERGAELSPTEVAFIQAGVALRKRRAAERERRRRRIIVGLAAGLIIALVLALLARQQWQRTAGLLLASQAQSASEAGHADLAVLLSLEALERYPYSPQAEHALGQAVLGSRLRLILHHGSNVSTAWWSPDGTRILTASDDATARVWDASASSPTYGEELLTLSGHDAFVQSAVWSPSGDQIVTASGDKTAKVWNAATGEEQIQLTGHTAMVNSAWWSPDGTRILTASDDWTAMVWDAHTGERLLTLERNGYVQAARWSPSGEQILTAGGEGARVWDAVTGTQLVLKGHANLYSAAWSPDGSYIATAGLDGVIKVWDASASSPMYGEELVTLSDVNRSMMKAAMWSPSGEHFAIASSDGTATIWDVSDALGTGPAEVVSVGTATPSELLTLSGHRAALNSVAWSSSGDHMVTASNDGTAKVWDVTPGPELLTLRGHQGQTFSVAWSPAGDRIVTGGEDDTAKVWDAATGEHLLTLEHGASVVAAWSPTGNRIVTAGEDGTARVWDANVGGRWLRIFYQHLLPVHHAAWAPIGDRIATTSRGGAAKIWNATSGKVSLTFPSQDRWEAQIGWAASVAWSPSSDYIITSKDRAATVWDAATGEKLLTLSGSGAEMRAVSWSPDGTRIVTHGDDGTARVWNATTGEELATFTSVGLMWRGSWSPLSDRFVTGCLDGTARVWDTTTGTELLTYMPGGAVYAADWSPDGTRIATASSDGTAKVFPAWQTTQELIDHAKACCVVRELTDEERELFGLPPR